MGHFEADSSEMLRFWPPEGGWVEGASLGERVSKATSGGLGMRLLECGDWYVTPA